MCRTPSTPGVYVEELPQATPPIHGGSTSVTAFVGRTAGGPEDEPVTVRSLHDFEATFGATGPAAPLGYSLACYFLNGGVEALVVRRGVGELHAPDDHLGRAEDGTGIHALTAAHAFNVLCIPPDAPDRDVPGSVYAAAAQLCVERRAILLVDPPAAWTRKWNEGRVTDVAPADLGTSFSAEQARNAAVYFPRLRVVDGSDGTERLVAPWQASFRLPTGRAVSGSHRRGWRRVCPAWRASRWMWTTPARAS